MVEDVKTTTLIGSCLWGIDVVTALRDNIEATLREIMDSAPTDGTQLAVPTYKAKLVGKKHE